MALTPSDFIFPDGALRPALLGVSDNDALKGVVEGYLARSVAETALVEPAKVEQARTAYVYWKAYEAAAVLQATRPTTVTIASDITETYGGAVLAFLKRRASEEETKFSGLLPPAAAVSTAVSQGTAYPTEVVW